MSLSPSAVKLPLRHLSIRVPWHDAAWDGTICRHPLGNGSCLVLENIHKNRDDAAEEANAGKAWNRLPQEELPPCTGERAGFMAPFSYVRKVIHPFKLGSSKAHTNFLPTPFNYPAYSAACIPFAWMRRENASGNAEQYGVSYDEALESAADTAMGFENGWIQDHRNQLAMLDTFFSAVQPEKSLCFFYAKDVPLAEASGRVLIGVGQVRSVGSPVEYEYGSPGPLRSMLWERPVHHSIRPNLTDGFLLPYHQLLEWAKSNPERDLTPFVAHAPDAHWGEFSYGSEHVSHDAAIAALLTCAEKLRGAATVLTGDWEKPLTWIDARLSEVWKMRGPFPGFGAALTAFGVTHGNFLAYELASLLQENEDPWPVLEQAFADPSQISKGMQKYIGSTLAQKWHHLPEERRSLLKLLARFDLTADQAKRFFQDEAREKARIVATDSGLLANPYLLYELDRHSADAIVMDTIDRGVFPDDVVREAHPLPDPSALTEAIDRRRVRAVAVTALEGAAERGDTLLPRNRLLQAIADMPLSPACQVDADLLPVVEEHFAGVIAKIEMADSSPAYQLVRLSEAGKIIRETVNRRIAGRRHTMGGEWAALLAAQLQKSTPAGSAPAPDIDEQRARAEKVAALEELAGSRVSVLIGPAGTGKTTVLAALTGHPAIKAGGMLMLTPTGKARVQLSQRAGQTAQTIAQFLVKLNRYDPATGAYLLDGQPAIFSGSTLIIDEASMLTEEQLAATLKALKNVERLILVGDPRQLPPIGSGRPFVDIVRRLQPSNITGVFPRVGPGYAELTVVRRQGGQARDDLLLANWFSGDAPDVGADEVWSRVAASADSPWLRFTSWESPQDLHRQLIDLLAAELKLAHRGDEGGFERSLGGTTYGGGQAVFFWAGRNGEPGAAAHVEDWQILSPVRGDGHGVVELNRLIQRHFRKQTRDWAKADPRRRKIPPPFGPEEILYGDKVMNTANQRRRHVYPADGAMQYVANGEIGVVVGQYKTRNIHGTPKYLQVEFSSQSGFSYDYYKNDVSEDGPIRLELAYAVTIHKAQGSEFGTTFFVLPQPTGTLSRELLYTALTRQRDRVVILHQGDLSALKRFASPQYSETARRLTNLFTPAALVPVGDTFLEAGLIHRTTGGDLVRSKSEVIIADLLHVRGVEYAYEQPLAFDGEVRYPDFTVNDVESGRKVYWEHLGLLHLPEYQERWQRKLAWYKRQDILPHEESPTGGSGGLLVISRDDEQGGIDAAALQALVHEVFPT